MVQQSGVKSTGIKQIVRLKGILQKWQTVTFGSKSKETHADVSPSIRRVQTDTLIITIRQRELLQSRTGA
ncbi:hypothetical protein GQ457_07G045560 [Hibiscus cannabinus]